jgi:hypothetical protein
MKVSTIVKQNVYVYDFLRTMVTHIKIKYLSFENYGHTSN